MLDEREKERGMRMNENESENEVEVRCHRRWLGVGFEVGDGWDRLPMADSVNSEEQQ